MSAPQQSVNLSGHGMTFQKVEDISETVYDPLGDDAFHLSDLKREDSHFKEIAIDFENAGLDVLKVQRLQNMMKWKIYKGHRDIILEERLRYDKGYDLKERYLYHGTAAEIKDICELGLDDKLSGNGCFGQGIYFSDNPKKCTKYANRRKGDEGLILCARVILGDVKVYPKGKQDRSLRREPEKTGKVQGWRFYDSVQGCPKDFTEYVVYRAQNVFIEYLITYSKSSTTKANHSGESITCPNKPSISADHDLHQHIKSCMSSSGTSKFSDKTDKLKISAMPNNEKPSDHLISASSIPSSIKVPDEDTSSDESDREDDVTDSFLKENTSSSDEDGELQRNAKEDSDSECTSNGSDTDSTEDLGRKERQKNGPPSGCGNAKKDEILLAQKRTEFTMHTGEYSEYLVETFLLASHFNVTKAVEMYNQKKKRDVRKRTQPLEPEEDKQKQNQATGGISEPAFVQGKTVPEFNSPQWNKMSEQDKEEVVKILVENFLSVTDLSEAKAPLAREILKLTDYNLDQAIVSYYESI